MDYFILKSDFYRTYPQDAFNKLINEADEIWQTQLISTIEEISSYLRARYDEALIFKVLKPFDAATVFVIGDRVYWIEDAYDATQTYSENDFVSFEKNIYTANTDIAIAEPFDPAKWDFVAANESKYECIADSTGNLPIDTDFFSSGDPRNLKMVELTADIIIYHILTRLNNVDIPVFRKERYDGNSASQNGGAIGYLKQINKGSVQPNLPLITENQEDQTGNIVIVESATESKERNFTF